MKALAGLLCGLLFGLGLAVSGMTDTHRVLGFLDLFGSWQPALVFVMGSAVVVTLLGFRLVLRQRRPLFAPGFHLPGTRHIDARLIGGAALFGIGWGLYGYCPGPAVTSLVYGDPQTIYFLFAMIAGMTLISLTDRWKSA